MNPALWAGLGVVASNVVWIPLFFGASDIRDWLRRRWPTNRQRHTLPSVRGDRLDSTASEVLEIPELLRRRQPDNWLDEGPWPGGWVEVVLDSGKAIAMPGPYTEYHARHRAEDTTVEFERIAADEGAPVRVHGPRETWLAELSVSAT